MDALDAIRLRRSVRRYTDRPVSDADLDELLRLALLAPTGGMSQSWSIIVVRETEKRRALADLVIRGGAEYFALVRPPGEGVTPEQHREWATGYAREVLGTYYDVPVWVAMLRVPRPGSFDPTRPEEARTADVVSVGFMAENLFVAARAKGLGTVPTVFHWFYDDEFRALLEIPDELETPVITPLGYPEEWPQGLPPALAKIRRPWRTLVHDEAWGKPRAVREKR
ncbi:MAG: nitroreductase family protein [Thermoleophilia bacterium]